MKTLLIILIFAGGLSAQTFTVEKVSGDVKYQNGSSETWSTLKIGTTLKDDAVISTGQNSSVLLKGNKVNFNLNESSAVSLSSIKKMNIDELLLALAMEDMMNAPKEIKKSSDNTAVYGTKEGESTLQIQSDNFGVKRLNGAVQLAENSLEESAVVAAKETYRIYFANILYDKGLYEEALDEYVDIQKLKLTDKERTNVSEKTESIKMKLLSE
jgi:hypothetical protein